MNEKTFRSSAFILWRCKSRGRPWGSFTRRAVRYPSIVGRRRTSRSILFVDRYAAKNAGPGDLSRELFDEAIVRAEPARDPGPRRGRASRARSLDEPRRLPNRSPDRLRKSSRPRRRNYRSADSRRARSRRKFARARSSSASGRTNFRRGSSCKRASSTAKGAKNPSCSTCLSPNSSNIRSPA